MVRIERKGQFLELYPNTKITFKMRSSLLTEDVIPLTYSLPFKLPMKGTLNPVLLDYPAHPQRKGGIQQMDVTIYFKDGKPRKAILKINTVNEDFAEANITVDKSLEDIANQKLPELLGDEVALEFETDVQQEIILKIFVPELPFPFLYTNYVAAGGKIDVKINGQVFETPALQYTYTDWVVMFNSLANEINAANIGVTAVQEHSGPFLPENLKLRITNDTIGLENLFTIDLEKNAADYGSDHPWLFSIVDEVSWLGDFVDVASDVIKNIDGGPMIFPPVYNPKFTSDERYVGWQNVRYRFNVSDFETIYGVLTPFPRLYTVLESVMGKLGYSISNNYISTGDFSKIYLYSNVDASAYFRIFGAIEVNDVDSAAYPNTKDVGILNNVFKLGNHLPDISVREFLNAIKSLFNLEFKYNPQRGEVMILPARLQAKDLMSAAPDMTSFAIMPLELTSPEVEATTIKSLGFEVDSSDALNQSLQAWQQPIIVNANGVKEVKAKVSSIRDEVLGIPYPQLDTGELVGPACSLELTGVIKDSGSRAKLKLLQYRGRIGLVHLPLATSRNTTWPFYSSSGISLEWSGESGLYELYWKNFVALRNDNTMMRCTMTYPPEIQSRLDDYPAQFIKGSLYIWKEGDISPEEVAVDKAKMLFVLI